MNMEPKNKYVVKVSWSGYSRGYATYEVYADDEDEAKKYYYEGVEVERVVVRDDTEVDHDETTVTGL